MSADLELVKNVACEENILEISTGELFTHEWRISALGEFPTATAAFYKTITISSDCSIEIKVKRLPIRCRHLPDYLHEGKIRIRDVSVELSLVCCSSTYIMTECSMSLRAFVENLSDDKAVVNNTFGECTEETANNEYFAQYVHTDIMTYLLTDPNDILTLVCRLEILFSSQDIIINSNPSIHLERLFGNKKFSDFVFTVDGRDFHVHKAILALWSPTFEELFENDDVKKEENRVVINDVDPKIFEEVLRFIYTGRIDNFYNIALGLLQFAHKYDISALKNVCEQRMCIHLLELPPEDAIVLLACAEMYECEWLKARIIEFIVSQANYFTDTNAWKEFISKNSQLANEIRDAMIRSDIPVKF